MSRSGVDWRGGGGGGLEGRERGPGNFVIIIVTKLLNICKKFIKMLHSY